MADLDAAAGESIVADVPPAAPLIDPEPDIATARRDRLLASLALAAGVGLAVATPFALKAGSDFFFPLTAALVIAVALVPILEWLERRRLPSALAALVCAVGFLTAANIALAAIVVPATGFFRLFPERITRIQHTLAPILDAVGSLQRGINHALSKFAAVPVRATPQAPVAPPSSVLELAATSAPAVIIQIVFSILVVYFFLAGWTRARARVITNRASFGGALVTARVIQGMVDDVSAYLGTITLINASLGAVVGAALYFVGMPFPLMWGGIVALLNYVPYLGPITAACLIAVGGLMTYPDLTHALTPAGIMIGCHLIEANLVTPLVVGHRMTINPLMILISLSFWGWVWGTGGVLLAVPLLIIIRVVLNAAGRPDIAGFLFEQGTLTRPPTADERR